MKTRRSKRKSFTLYLPARELLFDGKRRMSVLAELLTSNPRVKPNRKRRKRSG
jgi:hypothetical protein